MAKLQNVTRAHLGLLLANLVWAVNYPFYKVLMPHYITPVALATFAVTVAGLLGLVSLFWGGIEKIDRNDIYKFIGAALLMGIAKKLLLMIGMQHTSPIEASIIATLGPILVLVFSFFFGIDRFTPMKVFGMVLGMGGALLVILSGGGAVTSGEKLMGNLFVVGAIAGVAQRADHEIQADHGAEGVLSDGCGDVVAVRVRFDDPYRFRRDARRSAVDVLLCDPDSHLRP